MNAVCMMNLLAMAGLAENVEASALFVGYCVVGMVGILGVVGATTRFLVFLALSDFVAAVITLMFRPWRAFCAVPSTTRADPDEVYWIAQWQHLAVFFFVVLGLVIAMHGVAFWRFKRNQSRDMNWRGVSKSGIDTKAQLGE